MFFCSLKSDTVICTSLCRLLGVWRGSLFYSKCHKQYSCSIPRTYWSCVIIAKTLRVLLFYVLFSSNSVLFLWNDYICSWFQTVQLLLQCGIKFCSVETNLYQRVCNKIGYIRQNDLFYVYIRLETLTIKIYICTAPLEFGSYVFVQMDALSLTSYELERRHH